MSDDAAALGVAAWTAHLIKLHRFIDSPLSSKVEFDAWIAATAAAKAAEASPSERGLALPTSSASHAPLALPAPEDVNRQLASALSGVTLDVKSGEAVVLDQFGPVVVNSDGTLSRITNWPTMTDGEKETAKRLIAKRNGAHDICGMCRPPQYQPCAAC
jgi:hypothetical protein